MPEIEGKPYLEEATGTGNGVSTGTTASNPIPTHVYISNEDTSTSALGAPMFVSPGAFSVTPTHESLKQKFSHFLHTSPHVVSHGVDELAEALARIALSNTGAIADR